MSKKKTTEEFIAEANVVHNGAYDYSLVNYKDNKTKVDIICPIHGIFSVKPQVHLNGHKCPQCAKEAVIQQKKGTLSDFIEKAVKIHGEKYDYSKVKYVNTMTKVIIICKEHGEFLQSPNHHLQGEGCPECAKIINSEKHKVDKNKWLKSLQKKHNDFYQYGNLNQNENGKIKIICQIHGEFIQDLYGHKWGKGCPKCGNNISKAETEIEDFLKKNGVNDIQTKYRKIKGIEIDLISLDNKIGIEYNGLRWHSELYNSDKNYHFQKSEICNDSGINLIQIFEDEYLNHKDIVLNKLLHIFNKQTELPKIMGRKCNITEISNPIAKDFLNKYHIQGYNVGKVHLGAFYEGKLIGVMSFIKDGNHKWNLSRFATNYNYICQGVGGKLLKYFITKYNPLEIKSFADKRWTLNKENNLYTKLGFKLDKELKPDYRYYFPNKSRTTRFHKFNFRKDRLIKNFNFSKDLTEDEMCKKLGAYKIWDCGLLKYIWKKDE